jgi:hypothetical protein
MLSAESRGRVRHGSNMAGDVEGVKEALLNFAVTELSKPATNHVYSFMKYEMGASRHHILASFLAANDSTENTIEENAARRQNPCLNNATLTTCRDTDFRMHFRMNRSTIQVWQSIFFMSD